METGNIIVMIAFIIIIGIILSTGYFIDEKVAVDALHKQGFTDINITDKSWLFVGFIGCGDAINFMKDHYGDFKEDCEYSRYGWEYSLDKNSIFIENIEKLGPTIEIEVENKDDLENLLKFFDISELFSESAPEIMRKLQKNLN